MGLGIGSKGHVKDALLRAAITNVLSHTYNHSVRAYDEVVQDAFDIDNKPKPRTNKKDVYRVK